MQNEIRKNEQGSKMIKIINELNENNGSNYKIGVLKKHFENELLKRLLKMAYDSTTYTYGVTMRNIEYIPENKMLKENTFTLSNALDTLENEISTRKVTGNSAINLVQEILEYLSEDDASIIEKVLGRDLKINMGRSNINKVFKGLIVKPIYQRCDTFSVDGIDKKSKKFKKGTVSKINFKNGAKLDLKADGTYREATVHRNKKVEFISRSGEDYEYPILAIEFSKLTSGKYFGELTVELDQALFDTIIDEIEKNDPEQGELIRSNFAKGILTLPRAIGNGLINSSEVPHKNIIMDVWEYVTEEEYVNAGNKVKNTSKYFDRFQEMEKEINSLGFSNIRVCEYKIVYSINEAFQQVSTWMNLGLEGGVLKNLDMVYRDGTNPEQLKMKLKISVELRCTGFTAGTKGTKREATFGAMTFENDEKTIKGQTSGFSDELLKTINANREKYIGMIVEIEFNDLTKARGSESWSLSHPRFIEVRDDKTETDTLEKAFELRQMAMTLKEEENPTKSTKNKG